MNLLRWEVLGILLGVALMGGGTYDYYSTQTRVERLEAQVKHLQQLSNRELDRIAPYTRLDCI